MPNTGAVVLTLVATIVLTPFASADRERLRAGEAVVFADPNFRGASRIISGPETNLTYLRFNDTISSIQVRGTWEICADPNFRGRCRIVSGSEYRLSEIRMNDNISSMRPVSGHRNNIGYNRNHGNDRPVGRQGRSGFGQGVNGSRTVFFPSPRDAYGDTIRRGQSRANEFCYGNGLGKAVYSGSSGGQLVDVLCSR
ncbi:MAG: beta/gamma crystallin-related protein [Pseudomonadota bacterium]